MHSIHFFQFFQNLAGTQKIREGLFQRILLARVPGRARIPVRIFILTSHFYVVPNDDKPSALAKCAARLLHGIAASDAKARNSCFRRSSSSLYVCRHAARQYSNHNLSHYIAAYPRTIGCPACLRRYESREMDHFESRNFGVFAAILQTSVAVRHLASDL